MSNAPEYKGAGQPVLSQSTGWLGLLGNLFGQGGAPAYHGPGQPESEAAGILTSAAPVYRQAPIATQPEECAEADGMRPELDTAQAVIACPADCDPFAKGPIAIFVPRQG